MFLLSFFYNSGEKSPQATVLRVDDGLSYDVMWMSTDDETHLQVLRSVFSLAEWSRILAPLCPNVKHLSIYMDTILPRFPHRIMPMPMESVITVCLRSLTVAKTLEGILFDVSKSYPNAQIVDLQVKMLHVLKHNTAYTHKINLSSLRDLTIRGDKLSDMDIRILAERYPNVKVTSREFHEDSKQDMGMTFKPERKTFPYAPHSPTSSVGEFI